MVDNKVKMYNNAISIKAISSKIKKAEGRKSRREEQIKQLEEELQKKLTRKTEIELKLELAIDKSNAETQNEIRERLQ